MSVGFSTGAKTEFVVQATAEIAGQTGAFRGGLRGQLVSLPWSKGDDNTQTSVTPFIGLDTGGFYGSLGMLINLDKPAGFSFDEGKLWGLKLALGGRF